MTESQAALQEANVSNANFATLKEAQLNALQQSRAELVERTLKERTRADQAVQQAARIAEELRRADNERGRLSALVERLIAHTATSTSAISVRYPLLSAFCK